MMMNSVNLLYDIIDIDFILFLQSLYSNYYLNYIMAGLILSSSIVAGLEYIFYSSNVSKILKGAGKIVGVGVVSGITRSLADPYVKDLLKKGEGSSSDQPNTSDQPKTSDQGGNPQPENNSNSNSNQS